MCKFKESMMKGTSKRNEKVLWRKGKEKKEFSFGLTGVLFSTSQICTRSSTSNVIYSVDGPRGSGRLTTRHPLTEPTRIPSSFPTSYEWPE